MTIPAPNDPAWQSLKKPTVNSTVSIDPPQATLPHPAALPSATPAQKVEKALSSPDLMVGMGRRPPQRRRAASLWQKTAYVLTPLLITPLVVGAVGTVGFVGIGALAGAVIPSVGFQMGMATGMMGAIMAVPTAMSAVQLFGVFQAIGRLKTSRPKLAIILEDRRARKMNKKASRKLSAPAAPLEKRPISAYSHLSFDAAPGSAPIPAPPPLPSRKGPK